MSTNMPQFDLGQMYADVLTKGFYFFDGSELLEKFPIQDYAQIPGIFGKTSGPCKTNAHVRRYTELSPAFEELADRLADRYFPGFDHRLVFDQFQHFVHPAAHAWHKDPNLLQDGSKRTCTLNCYYESYDETTGGELQFYVAGPNGTYIEDDDPIATGNIPQIDDNDPSITGVFPQKHMIIIINQTTPFLHRVTPLNKGRDLILYNFNMPGLDCAI